MGKSYAKKPVRLQGDAKIIDPQEMAIGTPYQVEYQGIIRYSWILFGRYRCICGNCGSKYLVDPNTGEITQLL